MNASSKHGDMSDLRPTGVTACDVGRIKLKFDAPSKSKAPAKVPPAGVAACDAGGEGYIIDWQEEEERDPPVYNHKHGNKIAALDTAQDDEAMGQAMKDYMGDWYSPGDTTESYVKTWTDFHQAYWGGIRREKLDVLPLTPMKMHTVGSFFKKGTYRSAKNY